MTTPRCPRCDREIESNTSAVHGRGRPRKWCSDECRKLASEERRAAERGIVAVELRERVVEVEKVVHRPATTAASIDRVLDDDQALQKLLNTLRHRIKEGTYRPNRDPGTAMWMLQRLTAPVADLLAQIHSSAGTTPPMDPAQAVRTVLHSPRSCRAVLEGLERMARSGELDGGQHTATLIALDRLVARTRRQSR
ncbi:hypothetical protein [Rhodococcus opacus]|uniref:Uncharacterized protein n=1 Tax=Rhodococcus opacus (strain B4) TaxID=632772 RepID=C1BEF6_RHOOB|nr:hypothetical protein [Rhodococcus opacus]BAH47257.1 hypothetical protein ROP_pKNR01-00040 [Rhodococcus opacus B4]